MLRYQAVLAFSCAITSAASAATAKQYALDYESCIVSMKHVSNKEIEKIMGSSITLTQKSVDIAMSAADSCIKERQKLEHEIDVENLTDAKYTEAPENIRTASMFVVRAQMLDTLYRGINASQK